MLRPRCCPTRHLVLPSPQYFVGQCTLNNNFASPCYTTTPTIGSTFTQSSGFLNIFMGWQWGFASSVGIVSSSTGYNRNGMPYVGRTPGRMDRDAMYTARVGFSPFSLCTSAGNTHVVSLRDSWCRRAACLRVEVR